MERNEMDLLLADYLGGEMDPEARARFEKALHEDPGLAQEVAGFQATLATMHSLGKKEKKRKRHLLGYAAAVLLAFAAGFYTQTATTPKEAPPVVQSLKNDFVQAYLKQPERSTLARSLVALSHALR
jgi:anti-sigma factor RsiW